LKSEQQEAFDNMLQCWEKEDAEIQSLLGQLQDAEKTL
jgi:hypothetical protein